MSEYARRQALIRRPVITEEPIPPKTAPVITIHLLNEIRQYCNGCGLVMQCPNAKSAGALEHCEMIKKAEPQLRAKAGC